VRDSTDPLSAPLSEVLKLLCEQFDSGKQYRTINTIRSAIRMTYNEGDGLQIGQHPLVSRFLKEVFNSLPPAPRYWDVNVVLCYLDSLPDNSAFLPSPLLQTNDVVGFVQCRKMLRIS